MHVGFKPSQKNIGLPGVNHHLQGVGVPFPVLEQHDAKALAVGVAPRNFARHRGMKLVEDHIHLAEQQFFFGVKVQVKRLTRDLRPICNFFDLNVIKGLFLS